MRHAWLCCGHVEGSSGSTHVGQISGFNARPCVGREGRELICPDPFFVDLYRLNLSQLRRVRDARPRLPDNDGGRMV